jgi:hypothetical protein
LKGWLTPIRERFTQNPGYVLDVLRKGRLIAGEKTQTIVDELRTALGVFVLEHNGKFTERLE